MKSKGSIRDELATVGGRLRWAINDVAGMSLTEFARIAGVQRPQLSRWVNDAGYPPNAQNLKRMADLLGFPVSWLRDGGTDSQNLSAHLAVVMSRSGGREAMRLMMRYFPALTRWLTSRALIEHATTDEGRRALGIEGEADPLNAGFIVSRRLPMHLGAEMELVRILGVGGVRELLKSAEEMQAEELEERHQELMSRIRKTE